MAAAAAAAGLSSAALATASRGSRAALVQGMRGGYGGRRCSDVGWKDDGICVDGNPIGNGRGGLAQGRCRSAQRRSVMGCGRVGAMEDNARGGFVGFLRNRGRNVFLHISGGSIRNYARKEG